jgi:acetyl-CoA C-acetyltransferase
MEAYIVGACRTAIGKFNGTLAPLNAIDIGAAVIKEIVARTGVSPDQVNEVIFGNVIQAGLGQNPARQAAIKGCLPETVPAFTVNKVCGSGLKTVALAGQSIAAGDNQIVLAGGTEHMTAAPYLLKAHRFGQRLGHGEVTDSVVHDALWDKFYDCHMATTAENIAEKYQISRADQDAFSADSQQKVEAAIKAGKFKDEIVPITVKQGKQETVFDIDEHPRFGTTAESLAKLKPSFSANGTITAGNASGINDGAAAVMVVSKEIVEQLKPAWAFKILGTNSSAINPAYMGLGPISASQGLLERGICSVKDLDLIEVNEAFASQSIQVHREMGWDMSKVNVNGGAIALGHPVGASGTRILVTLLYEMVRRDSSLGLASLCIGGGQGIALLVERVR